MKKVKGEMSERQAARIIEMYENAMRNGVQWTHDVLLHRGTDKYEHSMQVLNEAFEVKCISTIIRPLASIERPSLKKRSR